MSLIFVILGILVGVFIFSSHERAFAGMITGGVIGYLFSRILLLQRRVSALDQKLASAASAIKPSVLKRPADARATTEPEKSPTKPVVELADEKKAPQTVPVRPAEQNAIPEVPKIEAKTPAANTPPAKDESPRIEWLDIIAAYFTGGNVVVRVGVIVLFFGVGFLLKYSIENNMVPIELRIAGVCLGGIAMLIIGWRLRISKTTYALILQGGGVGVIYLSIFSALKLYQLIPVGLALALMVVLPVFSAALAVIQDARALAVIGIIGGFLAPVLTSTGGGSHVVLFSYYALLNSGILLVAWFRSWRELNLIGFAFTFVIGALWGSRSFKPELFSSTEPFLILFFCFYVLIGLLFSRNQPLRHKGYIDCTLVFGTPIICFALQSALVKPYEYGLAWSALGMGAIYVFLAWLVFRKGSAAMRTLIESFIALGVVFGTIAIPLALDGRWTAAAWALEGSAVIWIAIRQNRPVARIFGVALQFLAGVAFLSKIDGPTGHTAVINGFYLGCLAVSAGAFFSSFCLIKAKDRIMTAILESRVLLGWSLVWWFGAGINEIDDFAWHSYKAPFLLGFWSFSALASLMAAEKFAWKDFRHVYKSLLPVMTCMAVYWLAHFYTRPSAHLGFFFWPLALIVQYRVLYLDKDHCEKTVLSIYHPLTLLLIVSLISWEASWWTNHWVKGPGIWPQVVLALIPSFCVLLLTRLRQSLPWPVSAYPVSYLYHALGAVVIYLSAGSIYMNLTSRGNPWPLSYIPLLNPLDITQMIVLLVVIYWFLALRKQMRIKAFAINSRRLVIGCGGIIFYWLNAVLIRTIHYWGNVPFNSHQMMKSELTQTALSIFWTLSSMIVMRWAKHNRHRNVWMVGAALIGIVVVKLFTIDLVNSNTVERIISFLGVGVLCLVIGYIAPLPPKKEAAAQ